MKPTAILWNYTHRGKWDVHSGGFRLTTSTNGKLIIPCVGGSGWRLVEKFIHDMIHKHEFTNRIWLEYENGTRQLVWWYEKEWVDRKAIIDAGLQDALLPFDVRWS